MRDKIRKEKEKKVNTDPSTLSAERFNMRITYPRVMWIMGKAL